MGVVALLVIIWLVSGGGYFWPIWPAAGWGLATEDEGRRPQTTMEDLANLKTPFRPHGRVTAGTSSPLTDGATMSILAGGSAVKELGLRPKMRMVSFAFAFAIQGIPCTRVGGPECRLTVDRLEVGTERRDAMGCCACR